MTNLNMYSHKANERYNSSTYSLIQWEESCNYKEAYYPFPFQGILGVIPHPWIFKVPSKSKLRRFLQVLCDPNVNLNVKLKNEIRQEAIGNIHEPKMSIYKCIVC